MHIALRSRCIFRRTIVPPSPRSAPHVSGSMNGKPVSHRAGNRVCAERSFPPVLPRTSIRQYSHTVSSDTTSASLSGVGRFIKESGLTPKDGERVMETVRGLRFTVFTAPAGERADMLQDVVRVFFKGRISDHPGRSMVVGTSMLPFDPEAGMVEGEARPIASAVMSCEGKSELQFYRGSRSMVILSHKAWSVKVGGTDPAALEQDKIRLAEIGFPPNSMVLLEFANGMLHGFEGDFGAISTHCIDGWDRVWLPWEHPGATPQDLIRKRTISVDPGKLDVIGGTRIPYQVIQELQALEATRAAESAEHLDAVKMLLPL